MNSIDSKQLQACSRDQAVSPPMQPTPSNTGDPFQLEQYKLLFRVISKVQETSDLNAVFQFTVQEVRQFLNADRVSVYRLDPNVASDVRGSNLKCKGAFVAEAVLPEFSSVLMAQLEADHFWAGLTRQYEYGEVQAVADICSAGLSDCHTAALAQFQIRANLVIPLLLQSSELWGLLCIHQCSAPREWQPAEIEFVTQVAAQMAIALKQAERLDQNQRQSQALAEVLEQLNRSQAQLIQTEKLSSLGQIVAGITAEINHPVDFISSSLTHANQYIQQIIALLRLYQQEHTTPSSELGKQLEELHFVVEDFPKLLSAMQLGSDRIRQLVLTLADFSRTDTSMQLTNLQQGIDNTLLILHHRLKPTSDSRGIHVTCEHGDLPLVECYANQINQVLMNLISTAIDALETRTNAIEAISDLEDATSHIQQSYRPQIRIRTLQIPDPHGGNPRVVICIADNGAGIPAAVQEKLFEPFFTTESLGEGTGLGLSICREIIVNQHRGDLQCYSQPGEGAEFWIELPVRQKIGSSLYQVANPGEVQQSDDMNRDALLYKA